MRHLASFTLGALCGVLLALLLTTSVTSRQASAPRPAQADIRRVEVPARTEAPTLRPSPSATIVKRDASPEEQPSAKPTAAPTPKPTKRPRATTRPADGLRGVATWYSYRRGQAAAGPRLRAALGAGWRGRTVYVNGVRVLLTDYMGTKNRAKVIDLDDGLFRRICGPLSMGVCDVEVRW